MIRLSSTAGMLVVAAATYGTTHSARSEASEKLAAELRSYFAEHCVACHGPKKQESDLRLDLVEVDFHAEGVLVLDRWEQVLRRIEAGEMPPMERPRPPADRTAVVVARLEKLLVRGHAAV